MVDPENLVLTILRTIQTKIGNIENDIAGIKQHLEYHQATRFCGIGNVGAGHWCATILK
jgi:hypothetical protein